MSNQKSLKQKIIDYVFKTSNQPVLFKDLLLANALYNEGMLVDPSKLKFRLIIKNALIAYALVCSVILIPLLAVTHAIFEHLDFHVSIIGTVFITSAVFIGFQYFLSWIRDEVTISLIKKAWEIHFPYFPYEKYSKKVEKIYNEAMKKEIHSRELQQYIMNKLTDQ